MQIQLPSLFLNSFDPTHKFWSVIAEWDSPHFPEVVIYHYETEMEQSNGDVNLMILKATAFTNDILTLKTARPQNTVVLDYCQFLACSTMLNYLARNKYFPICFDWIMNSIAEEVSTNIARDFFPGRIIDIIKSNHPFILSTINQVLPGWIHDLFYYSRHTGGTKELAEFCLEMLPYLSVKASKLRSLEYVSAFSQMSTWCFNFKMDQERKIIDDVLFGIYSATEDRQVKKMVAFHFSCLPDSNNATTRVEWASLVMAEYSDLLFSHERFQVLANMYEEDIELSIEHFDEILVAVKKYVDSLNPFHGTLFSHIRSTIFTILDRVIASLLLRGHVKEVNLLYGAFFNILEKEIIAPSNIFILPGLEDGVLYCADNRVIKHSTNTIDTLSELNTLQNSFLGTTYTRHDQLSFIPDLPERQGVPNRNAANAFCEALREHMNFAQMKAFENLSDCSGYFLLFGIQMPIQSILSLEIGVTIPNIHSFYNPLPARKIKRIFVWSGYTQMAEYERMGIEEIFGRSGCKVIWRSCFEASKEDFIHHYGSSEYDVFWILGHGQFIRHAAHTSYLDLGNEIQITIDELKAITLTHDQRRLLVIDACDGATNALANSPASIGIGTSVVCQKQSLISHNWPVENVPSLVMGLLLATFLSQGHSYSEAHHNATRIFYEGKQASLNHLRMFIENTEVLERIENNDFDYQNFYYWGSMTYII